MQLTNITKEANIKFNALTRVQNYMNPEQQTSLASIFITYQLF